MIVFVEIPVIGRNACGFFNTIFEQFIEVDGSHAFDSMQKILEIDSQVLAERCAALVTPGFFERTADDRDREQGFTDKRKASSHCPLCGPEHLLSAPTCASCGNSYPSARVEPSAPEEK